MKRGINIIVTVMIEWVIVRCSMMGISMSASGISDSRNISGKLISCLSSFADVLAERYPRDKWPTANVVFTLQTKG